MGFAKSDSNTIYNRRKWQRAMEKEPDTCGHVWQWDPEDRLMRCYKCGGARLAQPSEEGPIIRTENSDTDF